MSKPELWRLDVDLTSSSGKNVNVGWHSGEIVVDAGDEEDAREAVIVLGQILYDLLERDEIGFFVRDESVSA